MTAEKEPKGIVFNIQRYTIHDGPEIRTEVFLKGCTMHCKWCSNPEGISEHREVGVYKTKCIGKEHCGYCDKVCPAGAIIREEHGFTVGIDRKKCLRCFKCANACPANALKVWGREMTVDEVMGEILADRDTMSHSGGGATFSGGEALLQIDFLVELLKKCREKNVHTCVESALNVPKEHLEKAIPYTDMFIFDIKEMDSEKHSQFTGHGNERVLENAKRITETGIPYVVRIPFVPEHNGTRENIEAMTKFMVNEFKAKPVQIQFLRFRELGEEKYESLGYDYPMKDNGFEKFELEKNIHEMVDIMKAAGLPAVAGTTTPIKI